MGDPSHRNSTAADGTINSRGNGRCLKAPFATPSVPRYLDSFKLTQTQVSKLGNHSAPHPPHLATQHVSISGPFYFYTFKMMKRLHLERDKSSQFNQTPAHPNLRCAPLPDGLCDYVLIWIGQGLLERGTSKREDSF